MLVKGKWVISYRELTRPHRSEREPASKTLIEKFVTDTPTETSDAIAA